MQVEDCGDCLQLNVRMALEAGVARQLIGMVLKKQGTLPEALKDVYDYARYVAANNARDPDLINRIEKRYDKGALLEFGLCIASAKVFPTIKRALSYATSCRLIEIEV